MGNISSLVGNNRQYTQPSSVGYGAGKSKKLLPSGWTDGYIELAEIRDTKSGTGQYIYIAWRTLDDQHLVRDYINIKNHNPVAVGIGLRTLSTIARALDMESIDDTEQLNGREIAVRLAIEVADEWPARNVIKEYARPSTARPKRASDLDKIRHQIRGNEDHNQQATFRQDDIPADQIPF